MSRVLSWQVRWTEAEINEVISEVARVITQSGEKLPLGAAVVRAQQSLHLQGKLSYLRTRPDDSLKAWIIRPSIKALLNEEVARQIKSGETKPEAAREYSAARAKEIKLDKALEKAEALNVEQAMMIEQLQKALATSNLLLNNLQQIVMKMTEGGAGASGTTGSAETQVQAEDTPNVRKHRVLVVGPLDRELMN